MIRSEFIESQKVFFAYRARAGTSGISSLIFFYLKSTKSQRTPPSVVAYTESSQILVGQIAKKQAAINPESTFFSVKRLIGKKMSEIDDYSKQLISHELATGNENGSVKLHCPAVGKRYTIEEISARETRDATHRRRGKKQLAFVGFTFLSFLNSAKKLK